MKQFFVFIALCFLTTTFAQAQQAAPKAGFEQMKTNSQNFTYKIINSANHTFGYDIYNAGKLMIHQPTPPGMAGNNGFAKKQQAAKVAELVITKMKKGEMPPTVSAEELKKIMGDK